MSKIILEEQAAPDTPASGKVAVYPKTDGKLYLKNDEGDETELGGSTVSQLSDLSDVGSTTPTDKNALMADGDSWESRALVEADISDFGTYLENVSEDLTPQLGGNLDVAGQSIVSASDGDIAITPNGTGDLILDGLKWPQADGTEGQVLKTDGSAQLSWTSASGGVSDIVDDTTPQLGGDLDLNGHAIDFPTTPNVTDCIDDDTMAAASAVKLATSESIKAYVDNTTKKLLTSNTTVTVGASGCDYTTITAALEYLSGYVPLSGITATVELKAGFVWAESVSISGIDLGWITITSDNPDIAITALANNGSGLVRCSSTGHGLVNGDVISIYTGAGAVGSYIFGGWVVTKISDDLFDIDCSYTDTGTATARKAVPCTETSLTGYVLSAANSAIAPAFNILLAMDGAGTVDGIYIKSQSKIFIGPGYGKGIVNASRYGIRAYNQGMISINGGCAVRLCGSYGILSQTGSNIMAENIWCNGNTTYDYAVLQGSVIDAGSAKGSPVFNVTVNTISSSGLIFG